LDNTWFIPGEKESVLPVEFGRLVVSRPGFLGKEEVMSIMNNEIHSYPYLDEPPRYQSML